MDIKEFDDLVELWDREGQPPEIDWLEYAQDFRNQTQQLEAKNNALMNHVQHRIWCEAFDGDGSCDCGLDALLAQEDKQPT